MLRRSPNNGFGRGSPTAPTGVPAWLAGLAVLGWAELPGSAMSNFPPSVDAGNAPPGGITGPSSRMDTWSGFCIDTRTGEVHAPATGGHADCWDNGFYTFDPRADLPVWTEKLATNVSGVDYTAPSDSGRYSNGRPASSHTYWTCHYVNARNRAMRFGNTAVASSGFSHTEIQGFDTTVTAGVDGWDALNTYPSLASMDTDWVICKDTVLEDVYVFNTNNAIYKWTQATNSLSTVNVGYPPNIFSCGSGWDPVRNQVVIAGYQGTAFTFVPSTGIASTQTLTGAGATRLATCAKGPGGCYEPNMNKLLLRMGDAGGDVYAVDPVTFATTVLATTGGSSIPQTTRISGNPENVYGRFFYVPNLGGVSGVLYFPQYVSNAWFLRTN